MTPDILLWAKLALAVVVGVVGIAGTAVPWLLGRRTAGDRGLAIADTFAAGVLGGAGLIHLLGSGQQMFSTALPEVGFPIALVLAGAGFMLILFIEAVLVPGHPGHHDSPATSGPATLQHEAHGHAQGAGSVVYPIVLLVVLSVHSILLGTALGAQSSWAGALIVFLAVIAHKGAAGAALGVGFHRAGLGYRAALPRLAFFSVMTPLGIVLGAAVGATLSGQAAQIFEGVFDSLGAGTFLYIAALDIIKTEFDAPEDAALKWWATAAGFTLMAVLALWL